MPSARLDIMVSLLMRESFWTSAALTGDKPRNKFAATRGRDGVLSRVECRHLTTKRDL